MQNQKKDKLDLQNKSESMHNLKSSKIIFRKDFKSDDKASNSDSIIIYQNNENIYSSNIKNEKFFESSNINAQISKFIEEVKKIETNPNKNTANIEIKENLNDSVKTQKLTNKKSKIFKKYFNLF